MPGGGPIISAGVTCSSLCEVLPNLCVGRLLWFFEGSIAIAVGVDISPNLSRKGFRFNNFEPILPIARRYKDSRFFLNGYFESHFRVNKV